MPKARFAELDFYDVWLPNLAPSEALLKSGRSADSDSAWSSFERRYRGEMKQAEPGRVLDLLAALSHSADFSIGCYCEDERRCHRSILRKLLKERGGLIES